MEHFIGEPYHPSADQWRGFALPSPDCRVILMPHQSRKEGCAVTIFFFRHYRQRGPVNALQMRLQG
jgi:hypothetical protein